MSTRTQTPPSVLNYPKVDIFNRGDFDASLWENGYDIILEEAVVCPCKGLSSDSRSTCENCLGTGWVFINPIKTRAFITSINRTTKFKDWSPEFIGTMAVTLLNANRIGFMDKITLGKNYGLMSEVLTARTSTVTSPTYGKFVFGTYRMTEVRSVFVFNGDTNSLIKLAAADYHINDDNSYVLDIKTTNLPVDFNGKISVSYRHNVTYNVIDLPHDFRLTKEYSVNGKRKDYEMPVQAIARKSQYELGKASNYAGNNISDNSYL